MNLAELVQTYFKLQQFVYILKYSLDEGENRFFKKSVGVERKKVFVYWFKDGLLYVDNGAKGRIKSTVSESGIS